MPSSIPVVPKNGLEWRSKLSTRSMPLAIAPTSCVTKSSRTSPSAHLRANHNHHQTRQWMRGEIRMRWRTQNLRRLQVLHRIRPCRRVPLPRREQIRSPGKRTSAMYSTSANCYSSSGMSRSNTLSSLNLSNENGSAKRTRKNWVGPLIVP